MAVFCLVDCDCFYVSAERLFEPPLIGVPVVALSNSDGCVVSRCPIAKGKDPRTGGLGIKMGAPFFEIKHLMKSHGLRVVSSNYALYQEVSNRVMRVLETFAPRIEVYSIDESWLDFSGVQDDLDTLGREIQLAVKKQVGIGVGVGFGPTKTLAKAANFSAKKWREETGGVVVLMDEIRRDKLLQWMPVDEIWGIGRQLSKRLELMGVKKAIDLQRYDRKSLRKLFNVNVEKTSMELEGVSCYALSEGAEPKQTIASTRSFGERITELQGLREAVTTYASRACAKLRSEGQLSSCLQVFIQTSRFDEKPYSRAAICALVTPSNDTREFVAAALEGLSKIYMPGYRYAKAGIILSQFVSGEGYQPDLFAPERRRNSETLMKIMDGINARYGRGSIRIATEPPIAQWAMKRDYLSDSFVTDWHQLKRVKMT
ncbi:translesion error-prone DNA polymerase V subunit UmuC [Pseudomonas sp. ST1]|uniref:translesion error-prone DNA polymerase V subunit UmuC n=1 Tax=Pseudomonas TaxID=286 RepID=UPI0006B9F9CF|nr:MULTISPECIES: translesion error-prone DNA polymerase V subunit UmuC [Pseudomonas]KPB13559.1 Error-prone [Pseudomonas savastanoi]KPY65375.1 Ultraviolet light resistance protein B [Pseudomonas savastanoi pv. savastanoi]RML98082.1 Ultraviolet light resistance protein B [Pseudomonas savastanoi]TSC33317.1 translesion error-prone DNA polymerase V subunit UmuC [Pseudomonas sp. ST1]